MSMICLRRANRSCLLCVLSGRTVCQCMPYTQSTKPPCSASSHTHLKHGRALRLQPTLSAWRHFYGVPSKWDTARNSHRRLPASVPPQTTNCSKISSTTPTTFCMLCYPLYAVSITRYELAHTFTSYLKRLLRLTTTTLLLACCIKTHFRNLQCVQAPSQCWPSLFFVFLYFLNFLIFCIFNFFFFSV